jgi:diaminopimelate decarboxylase
MDSFPLWLDQDLALYLLQKKLLQKKLLHKKTVSADGITSSEEESENGYFVYHLDKLKQHLSRLQQQDVIKLWYAVKANPLSNIINTLAQQDFNFDVASVGELNQVLAQDIMPTRILNTGPAKSKKQLHYFLQQGVNTFVVESMNQLSWLNECAQQLQVKPTVLLRVQLQWPEGEKNPLGGNNLTPFGLAISEWQKIQLNDYLGLNICGLHIFQWGNMLSNEKMYSLWSQMVLPLTELAQQLNMDLQILDLGGGLGLDYLTQTSKLSWLQIISDLARIKEQVGVAELWLELGRYAVGECGYYVTEVVDKKTNFTEQQLVLAAGINHIIRPAITEQAFPCAWLSDKEEKSTVNYHLHGPLCTSLDKLGTLPLAKNIAVGDELIFGYCGAYGFSESMPFFLCHDIAAEYIFEHGELTQVRAPQKAREYLR